MDDATTAQVNQFLSLLFPDLNGEFIEVRLLGKNLPPLQKFYPGLQALLEELTGLLKFPHYNHYVGVCPRREEKGSKEAVSHVDCLWADVDGKDFSGGKEEALKRIQAFPHPPTAVVDSGNGYHPYWMLAAPIQLAGPDAVAYVESYLRGLAHVLGADRSACEVARVLRLPGSENRKDPAHPLPVQILHIEPERRYALTDFDCYRQENAVSAGVARVPQNPDTEAKQPGIERVIHGCRMIRWARENQAQVSEPLWYAMISNLVRFDGGQETIHAFSKDHPGYSPRETDAKIAHALKDTGPHTCRYIQEQGFDCTVCPWKGKLVSPASLAHKDVGLPELIETLTPGQLPPLQEAVSRIAQVPSPLEREAYLKAIATKKLGYSVSALRQELERLTPKSEPPAHNGESEEVRYSAVFSGLVDIVEHQEHPAYLVKAGERLVIQPEAIVDGIRYLPPPKAQILWLLPRAEEVIRIYEEQCAHDQAADTQLFDDLRAYHQAISDLPDERHYDLLAAWDLHTYLLEQFGFSPIICFFAVPERGKSRTGKGMIYVAYRGVHVETLRESNLIRLATHWQAALFFDVMDLWKKAERNQSEDVILNRFERGVRIPRVLYPERGAHQDTVFFEPFGATVIGTNESLHHILETRAVQITMPESDKIFELAVTPEAALPLKERLLAFRARHLAYPLPDLPKPASGRLGDILKPLYQIIRLVRPERESEFLNLARELEGERRLDRSEGLEAGILRAVVRSATEVRGGLLPVQDITASFNDGLPERSHISEKKVGWRLRALGFERGRMGDGSRAIRWDETKLCTVCQKYGVEFTSETPETSGVRQF